MVDQLNTTVTLHMGSKKPIRCRGCGLTSYVVKEIRHSTMTVRCAAPFCGRNYIFGRSDVKWEKEGGDAGED